MTLPELRRNLCPVGKFMVVLGIYMLDAKNREEDDLSNNQIYDPIA